MSLSNTHKIPEIQKLLNEFEDEVKYQRESYFPNEQYAQGIEHCIEKIREIIDSA